MLQVLMYISIWYALGMFIYLFDLLYSINIKHDRDEIKVEDIADTLAFGLFGPLLILVAIWMFIEKIHEKVKTYLHTNRSKVLWRSRRGKHKKVLYGEKDDGE